VIIHLPQVPRLRMSGTIPLIPPYPFTVRTEKLCFLYNLFIKFPSFHSAKCRVHLESRSLVSCHRIVAICSSFYEDLSLDNGIAAAALLSEDSCRPRITVDDKRIPQNRMTVVSLLALRPLEHLCSEYLDILSAGRNNKVSTGLPQQAEVAQGVPGSLRPRIFLTFGTTRVVGRQPYAPAALTPGEIPGTHFQRLSRLQGTWFCRGYHVKNPQ